MKTIIRAFVVALAVTGFAASTVPALLRVRLRQSASCTTRARVPITTTPGCVPGIQDAGAQSENI